MEMLAVLHSPIALADQLPLSVVVEPALIAQVPVEFFKKLVP